MDGNEQIVKLESQDVHVGGTDDLEALIRGLMYTRLHPKDHRYEHDEIRGPLTILTDAIGDALIDHIMEKYE